MASVRTGAERGLSRIRGAARIDQRTKNLIKRLRPGDIAIIDHIDLDGLAARGLAEAGVAAVINQQPFISGKYPNRGPAVLLEAGIPLFQIVDSADCKKIKEGSFIVIDESAQLYQDDKPQCSLRIWDRPLVELETESARANLGSELERFARNTLQYLDSEKDLLLDPTDVPPAGNLRISGRQVLIIVRGEGYRDDLKLLRSYIMDMNPLLIAVDGGADALMEVVGRKPDVIMGDMDSVTDTALRCGARLIVHAYAKRGGEAPGMRRIEELGLTAEAFAVPGTSEDAALLFAYEHNADLIVAVGTHSNLEDFLDKGRAGMASTFLVRLKVGNRLVDARGVYKIYRSRPSLTSIFAVILSAMFPLVILLNDSQIWRNVADSIIIWWKLHVGWPLNHR